MHNHVANRGRKALLNQIFSVFLIFTLYFNCFNSAYAAGGFAPWSITNTVAQGASTILTGSKEVILNGAKKIVTGTAKITPTAAQVSKVLARGAAGYALSVAVEQLLGSVDWVLDPANNQIKYKELGNLIYSINAISPGWDPKKKFASHADLCRSYVSTYNSNINGATIEYVSSSNSACVVNLYDINGNKILSNYSLPISTSQDAEEKKISLDTVAAQVISNAQANDVKAQEATTAAAADIINEAENDNVKARPIVQQLENTQSIPTDQTAQGESVPKENTNTGDTTAEPVPQDIKLDFPIFCDWAPSICQAAKWVITQPQVWADAVTDSWDWTKTKYEAAVTSISDFFKNETNESENDLPDIHDIPTPDLNTNTFKATAGCPQPIPINITIGTKGTGSISYEPICQFASKWSFVAPLIGFLSGAMILVGVGRKGEDGEI